MGVERSQSPVEPELAATGELLRAGRPELSALELDRLKRHVYARAHTTQRGGRRRFTALAAVVLGVATGATGATLGVAAVTDGDGNAAAVQYVPVVVTPPLTNPGGVLGEGGQGGNGGGQGGNGGGQGPHGQVHGEGGGGRADNGEETTAAVRPVRGLQPTRQLASVSARSLPFTGYLAIPALALGTMLTAAGLLLLRRQRRRGFS